MYTKVPPESLALSKAIEVCGGNLSSLEYLEKAYAEVMANFKQNGGVQDAMSVIADTVEMARFVHNERSGLDSKIHDGTITEDELKVLAPDYFNFQDLLTKRKLEDIDKELLADKFKNILMVYEISDSSEFVRGYVSNGEQLSEKIADDNKIIDLLDQAFHSWLVSNGMINHDGIIYDKSTVDSKGNYTKKINPKDFKKLISSPDKGLDAAIKKQDKTLSLEVMINKTGPKAESAAKADSNL